jgi:hypothetical protein
VLSHMQILSRSLKITAAVVLFDLIVGLASTWVGFLITDVLGNLLLFEAAALFIIAGVFDLGSSAGMVQFRKLLFSSKEEFSPTKQRETERSSLAFIVSGFILLALMILLALLDLSIL